MAKVESVPRQCRHEAQDSRAQEDLPCLMAKLRDRGGAVHCTWRWSCFRVATYMYVLAQSQRAGVH